MSDNKEIAVRENNLPKYDDLVQDTELTYKENKLAILLNQPPPQKWLKEHPLAKIKNPQGVEVPLQYLPIDRVEWLLTKMFPKWWVEVKDVKLVLNSVVVIVRLYVTNPVSLETEWQDGVGANPIQMDKGAMATELSRIKHNAVQIGAPAAETYAIKDAAEKFGKLFGRDLGRLEALSYDTLQKQETTLEDLRNLWEEKGHVLQGQDAIDAKRIIENNEVASFAKLYRKLSAL